MHPSARFQTAMEIIQDYEGRKGPLASFIKQELKKRRYAGSKDRREITDLVFKCIRTLPAYTNFCQNPIAPPQIEPTTQTKSKQTKSKHFARHLGLFMLSRHKNNQSRDIESLFTGQPYQPEQLSKSEKDFCHSVNRFFEENLCTPLSELDFSPWLRCELAKSCDETDFEALLREAHIDIRCNTDRSLISSYLKKDSIPHEKTPFSPTGIRLHEKTPITNHKLFSDGKIDIQDESSQILCHSIAKVARKHFASSKHIKILDLCAGGGGKSLALATLLPTAKITSTDIDPKRLAKMHPRLKRQNIPSITLKSYTDIVSAPDSNLDKNAETFDIVLVDAPCSGSGTLRRFPEKHTLITADLVKHFANLQRTLLAKASELVSKDGVLVYSTCSLLTQENQDIAAWFLKNHALFSPYNMCDILGELNLNQINLGCADLVNTFLLRPGHHETDGFFTAIFKK